MLQTEAHVWLPTRRRAGAAAEAARTEVLALLARHDDASAEVESRIRRLQESGGRLWIVRRHGAPAGVAVSLGGTLYVEAEDGTCAVALTVAAGGFARRIDAALDQQCELVAASGVPGGKWQVEERIELRARAAPSTLASGARWAEPADLLTLERAARACPLELGSVPGDWPSAIARQEVAVAGPGREIVSLAYRAAGTARAGLVGGLWCLPEARRAGWGCRALGHLLRAILEVRPEVRTTLPAAEAPAIGLFRAAGFLEVNRRVRLTHRSDALASQASDRDSG